MKKGSIHDIVVPWRSQWFLILFHQIQKYLKMAFSGCIITSIGKRIWFKSGVVSSSRLAENVERGCVMSAQYAQDPTGRQTT
jgi:hypothetical protein